jgi:hypothetical protein
MAPALLIRWVTEVAGPGAYPIVVTWVWACIMPLIIVIITAVGVRIRRCLHCTQVTGEHGRKHAWG